MEHLFALVIVDVPTYDAVEAALAPYDTSLMLAADGELEPCACNDPHCVQCDGAGVTGAYHNPRARRAWWVLGGQWGGLVGQTGGSLKSVLYGNVARLADVSDEAWDAAGVVVVSGGARHRWGGEQWNTLPSRGEARNFIRQRLLADNEERWVAGVDILTG